MLNYIKIYLMLWIQGIQGQIEYKLDFLLETITTTLGQVVGIAFIWVLFQNIESIKGWTLPEIMLVYGIAALPYGLSELLFDGVWSLSKYIRMGDFDLLMVRPINSLFFILVDQPVLSGLGNFLSGLIIIVIASRQLNIHWRFFEFLFLIFIIICGTAIYVFINIIAASLSFWFTESGSTILYLGQRLRDFTTYPIDIYTPSLRFLLTWIIPFAFTSFFPAQYLLRRSSHAYYIYLTPIVTLILGYITVRIWKAGVNQYESTGS